MNNIIELLFFREKYNPTDACIITLNRIFNVREVTYIVQKISAEIRTYDIKPETLFLTSFSDPVLEFFFTLSAIQLGLKTVSLHGGTEVPRQLNPYYLFTNRTLSEADQQSHNNIQVDGAWLKRVGENPRWKTVHHYSDNSVIRLILSSGTTGESKAVPLDHATFMRRLYAGLSYWVSPIAEMNLQSQSTVGGFFTCLDRLYLGLPIYLSNQSVNLFLQENIQCLTGSPIQISDFISKLENRNLAIPKITRVTISGGSISKTLEQRIRTYLSDEIRNVYGSTEIGGISIALLTAGAVTSAGNLLPGIEVEILKNANETTGAIKIRSPQMASQYFKDEENTTKYFNDGWFYPGDQGCIDIEGKLHLEGRNNEIANIGGGKVNLNIVDEMIGSQPGVKDCASFCYEDALGITQIGCALVVQESFEMLSFKKNVVELLGFKAPRIYVKIEKIPRNTMGKINRNLITQSYEQMKP